MGWEAPGQGAYHVRLRRGFADSTDEYPADNVAHAGHRGGGDTSTAATTERSWAKTPADGTVDFIAGVPYDRGGTT